MKITPHLLEDKPLMKTISWSHTPSQPGQIQYYITKRNLLNLRFMAIILTTLSWVIMLVVCLQPRWVTLEYPNSNLWRNITFDFGLWNNCVRCMPTNKLSVYLILSRGIIFLNLIFTCLLIISMMCSLRRMFTRISRLDFVFSVANYISGLAFFLCVMLFGLQVLDIFTDKVQAFHFKWPFYFSGFGILTFITAGTICLNSYKNSWNISYLTSNNLLTKSKISMLHGSLKHPSSKSVVSLQVTPSSMAINKETSITSILSSSS